MNSSKPKAFSLLEVVVAIGIFAVAMVGVIGLFGSITKSVGDVSEVDAASRVAELLNAQLQTQEAVDALAGQPFNRLVAHFKVATAKSHQLTDSDAKADYDIAADTQLIFASRDGLKVGAYSDAVWKTANGTNSDRDKFFEIALIRNEALSPNDPALDATAPLLAYVARVRWPAFVALSGGTGSVQVGSNPTATVKFDQSRKQAVFFSGTVNR